ncbi:YMGG-like glycine zipper-containing protein [Congregibacter variabilis]|uniref:YMGG-like glycine zipper-containing protein n=1 Tax=Congregibacter variabilis TaxID=3081200 RepID=A0ABZ0I0T8_9GAMM|nr:YMGG-like glycine zipper-containing protein [Congregibacter sp. IMCC43200]
MNLCTHIRGTLVVVALIFLGACTTTDEIIIDRKGVDMARYAADKAECEAYADEVRTGEKAARGAASGAVVGGAVGAIVRDSSQGALQGAGVGAVTGGARGVSEGERDKVRVVKRCLSGRGYRVLN